MNYIPYLGNKSKYSTRIHKILNGRFDKIFIEPFGGSGSISLYMSKFIEKIYFNELDKNIFKIHYSFKNGTWNELKDIIDEIWSFGDPRNNKEDYYKARTELNKKYFNENSIKSGFYNWAISTFAINSMVRFGPNGFNQGWGARGIGRTQPTQTMNSKKFNLINEAYKKITLFDEDFNDFIKRFNNGILFVDPPYVEMTSGIYSFSEEKYKLFLEIIKNWKDDVIYTDVFSKEKLKSLGNKWDYIMLRDNMGSGIPGKNKREQMFEALYFNFKIKNSLW